MEKSTGKIIYFSQIYVKLLIKKYESA